jgi:hypothetical protein
MRVQGETERRRQSGIRGRGASQRQESSQLWKSLRTRTDIHKLDEVYHADLAVVRPDELANFLITYKAL